MVAIQLLGILFDLTPSEGDFRVDFAREKLFQNRC
jgi:hypothetical protein